MYPPLLTLLLVWVTAVAAAEDLRLVSPAEIRSTRRDLLGYSIKDQYCWLLAHSAVRVGNYVYIDGGMAKYRVMMDREPVGVCDLNGHTVRLSLERDFDVDSPNLEVMATKGTEVPVANRGALWVDGEDLLIQGGHFYDSAIWNTSTWYKNKTDIPDYSIWRFSPDKQPQETRWQEDNFLLESGRSAVRPVVRTVSGAATCTDTECFWFGGYISSRTSPDTPLNYSLPQRGMLIYDKETKTIKNQTIEGYGTEEDGYQFGTIDWIPGKGGKGGLLVSLMGERSLIGRANTTDDDLDGVGVSLTHVMVYDLVGRRWYNQSTDYRGEPLIRTRFCSVLVYDEERDVHDCLFIYGGQSVADVTTGVNDLYVLSMPAFRWVQLKPESTTIANQYLRSHVCIPHGSQMLIIGGSWPSNRKGEVDQNSECTSRLVNVIDLNRADIQYQTKFHAKKTPYHQAERIRKEVGNAIEPIAAGWAHEGLGAIWPRGSRNVETTPSPHAKGPLAPRAIAGIAIGSVAVLGAITAFVWWYRRRNRAAPYHGGIPGVDHSPDDEDASKHGGLPGVDNSPDSEPEPGLRGAAARSPNPR